MRTHDFKELMKKDKHRIAWKIITGELSRRHFTDKQWKKFKILGLVKGN